jgi:hypothetical protein
LSVERESTRGNLDCDTSWRDRAGSGQAGEIEASEEKKETRGGEGGYSTILLVASHVSVTASVVQWSEFLVANPEVPGTIPGATRFSE